MKLIFSKPPTPTNSVRPISNHTGNPPHSYPSGMGTQGPPVSINPITAAHWEEYETSTQREVSKWVRGETNRKERNEDHPENPTDLRVYQAQIIKYLRLDSSTILKRI